MFRISSTAAIITGVLMFSAACSKSGGSPAGPANVAGPSANAATVTIVDALTSQPIGVGGTVTSNKGSANLEAGSAQLEKLSRGDAITISGVPGYRSRTTSYCGAATVSLWPNRAGDVDEPMTQSMAYAQDGVLRRPDALFLMLSDELRADPEAVAVHERAIATLTDAIQGKTRISLVTSPNGGGATLAVGINRGIAGGLTTGEFIGTKITGGKIEYQDMRHARDIRVVTHELGHALGLRHNPYPGLMDSTASVGELTAAERNILLLRYARPAGAVFSGDNDQMLGCR